MDGKPEIKYSLEKGEHAEVYGFVAWSGDGDQMKNLLLDRLNGKDISLHAVKSVSADKIPNVSQFNEKETHEAAVENFWESPVSDFVTKDEIKSAYNMYNAMEEKLVNFEKTGAWQPGKPGSPRGEMWHPKTKIDIPSDKDTVKI